MKARRGDVKPPSTGPGRSDQEDGRMQTEPRPVQVRCGRKRDGCGENSGGVGEKLGAVENEQNTSRVTLWRGSLRLAFERVGERKLQDVIGIRRVRRLSQERQRAGGSSVMVQRATAAVMQNQTKTPFAHAGQELVIGIKRSDQGRHGQPQRRARAGIQQQSAPAGGEPGPIAASVGCAIPYHQFYREIWLDFSAWDSG